MIGKRRNKKGTFTQTHPNNRVCVEVEQNNRVCVEVEQNNRVCVEIEQNNTFLRVRPECDLLKTISNLRLNFFNKQMYCNDHLHYSRLRKNFYIHEIALTKEV